MLSPPNQPVMRSAAVRAVELKAEFHRGLVTAARAIAGSGVAISVEHIEAAFVHAAEQIVRNHSNASEFRDDDQSRAA